MPLPGCESPRHEGLAYGGKLHGDASVDRCTQVS
jgi:hypothetical protein